MKTAVSLPDPVFRSADRLARRMKVSRSRLYAMALQEFYRRHRSDRVREQLNKVYGREESSLDPVLQSLQARSLSREKW